MQVQLVEKGGRTFEPNTQILLPLVAPDGVLRVRAKALYYDAQRR